MRTMYQYSWILEPVGPAGSQMKVLNSRFMFDTSKNIYIFQTTNSMFTVGHDKDELTTNTSQVRQ